MSNFEELHHLYEFNVKRIRQLEQEIEDLKQENIKILCELVNGEEEEQ